MQVTVSNWSNKSHEDGRTRKIETNMDDLKEIGVMTSHALKGFRPLKRINMPLCVLRSY